MNQTYLSKLYSQLKFVAEMAMGSLCVCAFSETAAANKACNKPLVDAS